LHALSRGQSLDFFVCFSSWASLGGSPGQANYCAANAYLDALAHYRRSLGLPALSINWGGWGQTGFATSSAVSKRLASFGMKPMQPAEALRCLELALRRGLGPQIAIGAVSWPRFLASQGQGRIPAIYRDFQAERGSETGGGSGSQKLTLAARIENTLPAKRGDEILTGLSELAAKVLGLSSAEQIDPEQPLKDYGMDSLIAVELRNSLCAALGRPVPPTALFDHPSIAALGRYVERTLFPADSAPAAVNRNQPTASLSGSLLDRIEHLSEEEVDRLFATAGTEAPCVP
jgi:acyl carrier protein